MPVEVLAIGFQVLSNKITYHRVKSERRAHVAKRILTEGQAMVAVSIYKEWQAASWLLGLQVCSGHNCHCYVYLVV